MIKNLENFQKKMSTSGSSTKQEDIVIGRKEFKELIYENIVLISRALRHQFIIPDFPTFTHYLDEFYDVAMEKNEGKPADYIPQLAKQNPDHFGVAVCTVDGQRHSIGDSTEPFTLQSCW